MNRGRGYTILEVLIFVAISGFMLIAAVIAIGGRQREVQFQQAARDFENKINDLIKDVSVGYFNRDSGFSCRAVNSEPTISYDPSTSGQNVQGQSGDCTLVGKAVVLGAHDRLGANSLEVNDKQKILIIDMAGLRLTDELNSSQTNNLLRSNPKPLYTSNSALQTYALRYGLAIEKVVLYDSNTDLKNPLRQNILTIMNNDDSPPDTQDKGPESLSFVNITNGVSEDLFDFRRTWHYSGDQNSPSFTDIVACVSGPSARNTSDVVTNWNHRETAALVIRQRGTTELVFDGSEKYCD